MIRSESAQLHHKRSCWSMSFQTCDRPYRASATVRHLYVTHVAVCSRQNRLHLKDPLNASATCASLASAIAAGIPTNAVHLSWQVHLFGLEQAGDHTNDQCTCWKSGASAWLAAAGTSRSTGCICFFECVATCCCLASGMQGTQLNEHCMSFISSAHSVHGKLMCILWAIFSCSV